jgi:hypothetical protein
MVPGESKMKKLMLLLLLLTPLLMTSSLYAVTYPFPKGRPAYPKVDAAMTTGSRLYLFHSSKEEVKNTININDTLIVYRESPTDSSLEPRKTGKVKILSTLGANYYEAEVIEGSIQPGSLARKGAVVCFITSFR